MLFSSLVFLFMFLPLSMLIYYILPYRGYRNVVLLVFSLLFYSWGEPVYVILMVVEIIFNYGAARFMAGSSLASARRIWLWVIVAIDLAILGFYKYGDFIIGIINTIFSLNIASLDLSLPIGISFYTFQILSYVIDVYRNKVAVQRNVLTLATYVTMFPQLIAGPIVRYETIEEDLVGRKETINDFAAGLRRFIIGLGKKVIIANNVAIVAQLVFAQDTLTFTMAWLGAIAYTLQIYFDFSGYSDMAIGLGRMFGFRFLENFNYPYIAKSITEFWRRWHISLSSWFRDYVYIPLGGNRVNKARWLLNIMIVWMLTGLWHGAAYNFVVWGLYYGVLLVIEKLLLLKVLKKLPVINHIYTLIAVVFGFVIFNSGSFFQIGNFFHNMFLTMPNIDSGIFIDNGIVYLIPYLLIGVLASTPLFGWIFKAMDKNPYSGVIYDFVLVIILVASVMFLVNNSYNPFIYFRF